jgi:hypothetical protein
MSKRAGTKVIPVRLSPDILTRLEGAAVKMHAQNRTDVIKFCISTFLEHLEAKGESYMPANWQMIVRDLDNRTHRYSTGIQVNGHHNTLVVPQKKTVVYKIPRPKRPRKK